MPDQTAAGADAPKASHDTFESLEREMAEAGLSVTHAPAETRDIPAFENQIAPSVGNPILDRIRQDLAEADARAQGSPSIDPRTAVGARILAEFGGKALMEMIAEHDPDALRYVPVGTAQAEGMGEFDWCSTFVTRTRFYPTAPEKNAYDIADIAHSLSRANRWGGHINVEYFSVAQHSVHVVNRLTHPAARFLAILHDAPEFILADMPRPIKRHVPGYSALEKKHEGEIYKRHGLRDQDVLKFWVNVKMADDACMREESLVLQEMRRFPDDWYWQPQRPDVAKAAFLSTYEQTAKDYAAWLATDDAKAA